MRIFEGERSNTDGNHLLGRFQITGIERAKKRRAQERGGRGERGVTRSPSPRAADDGRQRRGEAAARSRTSQPGGDRAHGSPAGDQRAAGCSAPEREYVRRY